MMAEGPFTKTITFFTAVVVILSYLTLAAAAHLPPFKSLSKETSESGPLVPSTKPAPPLETKRPTQQLSTPADPNFGLLTGTQLKAVLMPASYFPSGFKLSPGSANDTGASYIAPSTSKPSCTSLLGESWELVTGILGVSWAQNLYTDPKTSSSLSQEIDVFPGNVAEEVMTRLGSVSATCPSVTATNPKANVTIIENSGPDLGNASFAITETSSSWTSGSTLIAVRVGTAVVTVYSSQGTTDNGSAAAIMLMKQIVTSLEAELLQN